MMEEKLMKTELMIIDKNAIKLLIEHSEKRLQAFQEQIEIYTKEVHYLNGAISAWKIVLEKEKKDDSEDNEQDRRVAKETGESKMKYYN